MPCNQVLVNQVAMKSNQVLGDISTSPHTGTHVQMATEGSRQEHLLLNPDPPETTKQS